MILSFPHSDDGSIPTVGEASKPRKALPKSHPDESIIRDRFDEPGPHRVVEAVLDRRSEFAFIQNTAIVILRLPHRADASQPLIDLARSESLE